MPVTEISFELEPGKNVRLYGFAKVEWGSYAFLVDFIELNETRRVTVDLLSLEQWLADKGKDLTDFTKQDLKEYLTTEHLLPLYNQLEKAKIFHNHIQELFI